MECRYLQYANRWRCQDKKERGKIAAIVGTLIKSDGYVNCKRSKSISLLHSILYLMYLTRQTAARWIFMSTSISVLEIDNYNGKLYLNLTFNLQFSPFLFSELLQAYLTILVSNFSLAIKIYMQPNPLKLSIMHSAPSLIIIILTHFYPFGFSTILVRSII